MSKPLAKILFMGTPDFAVTVLDGLVQANYEVVQVITQPDRPTGRGKKLAPPPVKVYADKAGLRLWQPENLDDSSWEEAFRQSGADLAVVAAYGRLLPSGLLATLPLGFVNVHASLLPAYRGAAPIQWAIRNQDKETGVTLMQMDAGMDTGDMLAVAKTLISPDETRGSLFDRLANMGRDLLLDTLPKLVAGRVQPHPQDNSRATYAPMFTPEDEAIDWSQEAGVIAAKLRSYLPETGNYTTWNGVRLKIFSAEVQDQDIVGFVPGQISYVDKKSFTVQTGKGGLKVLEVQPPGKRRMVTHAFLNGNPLECGTQLGSSD